MTSTSQDLLLEHAIQRVSAWEQSGGLLIALGFGAVSGVLLWLRRRQPGYLALTGVCFKLAGMLLWCFRSPKRTPPPAAGLVLAACDGVVKSVRSVRDDGFLGNSTSCVEIAVRLGDVQVNRAPTGGHITLRRYEPATPHSTRPAADINWLGIRQPDGAHILLAQLSTSIWRIVPWHLARRIICWPDCGDTVHAGEVLGHLTLGGHVEVYLPANAHIQVRTGQRVRGGETILARL